MQLCKTCNSLMIGSEAPRSLLRIRRMLKRHGAARGSVAAVAESIGKEKTGIRLSPYGVASDMPIYPEIDETYTYLAEELNKLGIAYIHLVDHALNVISKLCRKI